MEGDLSNRVGEADERFVPGRDPGALIETEHLTRYWWAAQLADGCRVLDAGCGAGYGTVMLADAGASEVTGVDVAADAVRSATERAGDRASVREGDLRELPFADESFDLVVCFEVIEHVAEQDAVIAELARVLSADGVLAISSPNRDVYPPGNPHHVREYVPEELREALAGAFAHVTLYRQHDWSAGAVLRDVEAADDRLVALPGLPVGKLDAAGPGSEPYTIALASRFELPAVSGRVVLGSATEIRAWLGEIHTLTGERDRERDQQARVIAALTDERDRARADVGTLQQTEATLRADQATLAAQLEETRAALRAVHESLPWRAASRAKDAAGRLRARS